jgi:predicted Ser/Thr protein kinase
MATKLLMRWDIQPEQEAEYSDFVANEFIPRINKLGLVEIQAWYTVYGDCEQILVSGVTQTVEQMNYILGSDEWDRLRGRLDELVDNFNIKVVAATAGFQI